MKNIKSILGAGLLFGSSLGTHAGEHSHVENISSEVFNKTSAVLSCMHEIQESGHPQVATPQPGVSVKYDREYFITSPLSNFINVSLDTKDTNQRNNYGGLENTSLFIGTYGFSGNEKSYTHYVNDEKLMEADFEYDDLGNAILSNKDFYTGVSKMLREKHQNKTNQEDNDVDNILGLYSDSLDFILGNTCGESYDPNNTSN